MVLLVFQETVIEEEERRSGWNEFFKRILPLS